MPRPPDITRGLSPEQRAIAEVLSFVGKRGKDDGLPWVIRRLYQASRERAIIEIERGRNRR